VASPDSRNTPKNEPEMNPQYSAAPAIALHAFRPPVPARVQLQGNKPASVFFQGRSGKVIHASGPWRTSGQWWEDRTWQEDAWDLEIVFFGESSPAQSFYRFSYDGLLDKWFVRGVYD
jgi:protein ImuB